LPVDSHIERAILFSSCREGTGDKPGAKTPLPKLASIHRQSTFRR